MTTPIMPIGPLPRTRALRVGRERRVRNLERRLPYEMVIIPDPLLVEGEAAIGDDQPNAARAVLNLVYRAYLNGTATVLRCDFRRVDSISRNTGRVPTDEPSDYLDAFISGRPPESVQVTDVATILQEERQGVYTIASMTQDRWGYTTTMRLETFAHRGI